MKTYMPCAISIVLTLLAALVLILTAGETRAESKNHGDFTGDTVMFLGVTEASATDPLDLFGAPSVAGDALIFTPAGFVSHSSGATAGSDITDAQLLLTIMATEGNAINQVTINEGGDYTILGPPEAYAFAQVAAPLYYRVIELDGVAVAGPSDRDRVDMSPLGGQFLWSGTDAESGDWTGVESIDIAGLLTDHGVSGHATKVLLTLDNVLATAHAGGGSATIAKKEFDIEVTTSVAAPEPSALALAALGALGLAALVRRSRRACN